MPIPEHVVRLIEGPTIAHAGTRDGGMVPHHHLTWWLRVRPNKEEVEALLPSPLLGAFRENIADNGRIAVTACEITTHETYQLKGRSLEVREPTDEERASQRSWAETTTAHFAKYMPDGAQRFGMLAEASATYVRFHVDAVYEQTPGPRAGRQVSLDEKGA